MKFIKLILFILNLIVITLLLLSYTAAYVNPVIFYPLAFLGLAYPYLVLVNAVFIILWIGFFNIRFILSLLTIAIGYTYITSYIQIGAKKTNESNGVLKVVSFNTHYLGAYENSTIDSAFFFSELIRMKPDILCFQEFVNPPWAVNDGMFERFFREFRSYHYANADGKNLNRLTGYGVSLFSKYPIIKWDFVERTTDGGNLTLYADIKVDDDTIRVINTHLKSISFNKTDYAAIQAIENNNTLTSPGIENYKNILWKLKHAFIIRGRQSDNIREAIDESPYKVIMAGDFNDSPASYAYRTIKGNLLDSFKESGTGLSRTYVGKMPNFRIDYIMHDKSFTGFNYRTHIMNFSDHKMISCSIKIR